MPNNNNRTEQNESPQSLREIIMELKESANSFILCLDRLGVEELSNLISKRQGGVNLITGFNILIQEYITIFKCAGDDLKPGDERAINL